MFLRLDPPTCLKNCLPTDELSPSENERVQSTSTSVRPGACPRSRKACLQDENERRIEAAKIQNGNPGSMEIISCLRSFAQYCPQVLHEQEQVIGIRGARLELQGFVTEPRASSSLAWTRSARIPAMSAAAAGSEQRVLDERLAQASSLPGQVDRGPLIWSSRSQTTAGARRSVERGERKKSCAENLRIGSPARNAS